MNYDIQFVYWHATFLFKASTYFYIFWMWWGCTCFSCTQEFSWSFL